MIKSFKIDKLIRDKIPDILRSNGIVVHEKKMEDPEFILKLKEKLLEEAKEVLEERNCAELCEELADVLEIIYALSKANGLTIDQIEKKRIEKRDVKGGFDNKIFCSSVDIQEENKEIFYYLENSLQYPEIKKCSGYKSGCLFCQMARQEKEIDFFAKFKHCYAIKDQFPVSEGHILIIPYEHTDNWFTASEEVQLDMMNAVNLMKIQLDQEYTPCGYNIGANCGEVAGQSIMHLHVHLIPRYQGDMEDPKGGVRGVIPVKQKY